MGFFDWLFGKEKKPPEPLVLGAKLRCPYGSQDSYLYVDTEDIKINNLPKACVDDTKALFNILPFGECYAGGSCKNLMSLNNKWENPVPQGEKVNGKEIITTESLLACKVVGAEFKIISSGQDGIYAKQILFREEMDKKYPGLRDILENPYGSLYLNKDMYNKAIDFIENQIIKKGDIDLYTLFDEKNVEGNYLRSAFGQLLPYCDTSTMEGFVNGIQTGGVRQGISNDEGWNELKINKKTIEFLKKDCKETAHNIDTKPFYRWQEENKAFSSFLADGVNTIAYAAIMYGGMNNVSSGQSKYSKPVTQKVETKGTGQSAKGLIGKDFEKYLNKELGGEGSRQVGGRDFDGVKGNRWWEAKSGQYWEMLESDSKKTLKFKSDMGDRLNIAKQNGATYELFSNTPIPQSIKDWLTKKGIPFTEFLD